MIITLYRHCERMRGNQGLPRQVTLGLLRQASRVTKYYIQQDREAEGSFNGGTPKRAFDFAQDDVINNT